MAFLEFSIVIWHMPVVMLLMYLAKEQPEAVSLYEKIIDRHVRIETVSVKPETLVVHFRVNREYEKSKDALKHYYDAALQELGKGLKDFVVFDKRNEIHDPFHDIYSLSVKVLPKEAYNG